MLRDWAWAIEGCYEDGEWFFLGRYWFGDPPETFVGCPSVLFKTRAIAREYAKKSDGRLQHPWWPWPKTRAVKVEVSIDAVR